MSDVVVKTAFQVWDDVRHEGEAYPHGPGGCVILPIEAATPLTHNGGYRLATAEDIEAEMILLMDRYEKLQAHLERLSS